MRHHDDIALQLRHLKEALDEAEVLKARESFPAFCEYCMVDDGGKPWVFAPHQYEWAEIMLAGYPQTIIVGPRGCAKSTTVQALILFLLGRDPNLCVKYICGSDPKAIDRLRFIKQNIVGNTRYRRVFPHIKPAEIEAEWTKHKAFVERPAAAGLQDASIECACVTSPQTGGRAHLIIFDDIIDSGDAVIRPANLQKVKELVESDWLNLLYPGGQALMIGTFWSFDPPDIHVEYAERPDWHPWVKPACRLDEHDRITGPYLWPERWGKEQLEIRRQRGEDTFRQQYLLQGARQRSSFFSEEHIANCITTELTLGEAPFEIIRTAMGVDPGGFSPTPNRKAQNSYCAAFVAGLLRTGQKIPLAIVRQRADAEVLADAFIQLWRQWNCEVIVCENNATQEMLVSLLRVVGEKHGFTDIPVRGRFTSAVKWNPETGLPVLNAELAQQKWLIPKGGDHTGGNHQCPVCQWIDEMRYWGKRVMPNGRRPTTDIIMAWWLANSAFESGPMLGDLPIAVAVDRSEIRYGSARRVAADY